MTDQSILICGCGNMGGAMLAGWLRAGLDPERFTVVDPVLPEVPAGVRLLREIPSKRFDFVLLGIKPQALDQVAPALAPASAGAVLLSILAGAEIASLAARFPQTSGLVRVMPNLAAAIGKSPMGIYAAGLDNAAKVQVEALLAPLGTAEWLASEGQLDAVTALAGSGPAFIYRIIDALGNAGAELDLDPDQARRLALAMVEGAAILAASTDLPPEELARRVTSPGGTTAAGLAVLDHDQALARLISATLRAARDRGAEMAAEARQ
ncbi:MULTISPECIES: pyrroline-5-carboxylate reductase [unclassified Novosphingobium]|uniref:pyrroline-5-carboxylate reductase n=1 Tax=unclassified Novosphingobium TaxID=2644732 RepID=UPI0025D5781B|nr:MULTISPECIES: pyrroline-5-carboxylate reductase [unclassified Novosphingobium]HQV03353.1 pyrroline-5-carboxylate reductase [Novosphingobium sp.]